MQQIDAQALAQHHARKVRGRADRRGAEYAFFGILAQRVEQLLRAGDAGIRAHEQAVGQRAAPRHARQVGMPVERHFLVQQHTQYVGGQVRDEEGVAVGGPRGVAGADQAADPRHVLDHHGLSELALQRFLQVARHDVAGASRGAAGDEAQMAGRPRRPLAEGLSGQGRERTGAKQGQQRSTFFCMDGS